MDNKWPRQPKCRIRIHLTGYSGCARLLRQVMRGVEAVEEPRFAAFANARNGAKAIAIRLTQKIVRLFVVKRCVNAAAGGSTSLCYCAYPWWASFSMLWRQSLRTFALPRRFSRGKMIGYFFYSR